MRDSAPSWGDNTRWLVAGPGLTAPMLDEDELAVVTPTGVARDWVRRNAWRRIAELWSQKDPDSRALKLLSRAEVRDPRPAARQRLRRSNPRRPASRSPPSPAPADPPPVEAQARPTGPFGSAIPSTLRHRASANRNSPWRWPNGWPTRAEAAHFNPVLILRAPTASGKTHLLNAIAWEAHACGPTSKVVYLTAERFLSTFVRAVMDRDGARPSRTRACAAPTYC